jgi:hypothetical protein
VKVPPGPRTAPQVICPAAVGAGLAASPSIVTRAARNHRPLIRHRFFISPPLRSREARASRWKRVPDTLACPLCRSPVGRPAARAETRVPTAWRS